MFSRCSSYCIAESIDTDSFMKFMIENGDEPKYFGDVVHIQKEIEHKTILDIFVFDFGAVILWGGNENQEKALISEYKSFVNGYIEHPPYDIIYYDVNANSEKTYINEEENIIVLRDDSVFLKLSMSYALAQSVKLNVLELSVSSLLKKTAPLQKELAQKGYVSLSKKEISKKIGMLFNERYSINLHSDILDTPEFFWRRPSYEPIYLMTADFQDIQIRQNLMNHRLDMIHELYSILSNELNYKHSTRLEIIIVILIGIEVIMGLFDYGLLDKLFQFTKSFFM